MTNSLQPHIFGEKWKNVVFDFEHSNDYRLEVSNLGRVRSFNKLSDGNILKGSLIEGYKIIRLKFFTATAPDEQVKIDDQKNKISRLAERFRNLKATEPNSEAFSEVERKLNLQKHKLSRMLAANTKVRTIHKHYLIHRLVAEYFLTNRREDKTVVGHKDFNKLNNEANNLMWMTPDENYQHQQQSPYVIEERKKRIFNGNGGSKATKLTITKVMLLKKLLNSGKTTKQLAKQFKVSDMQIIRIRRGENWGSVPAAY